MEALATRQKSGCPFLYNKDHTLPCWNNEGEEGGGGGGGGGACLMVYFVLCIMGRSKR